MREERLLAVSDTFETGLSYDKLLAYLQQKMP